MTFQDIIDWTWNNWGVIATALFGLSEVLAHIPAIKSNSVFQTIIALLVKLMPKKTP